jgi:DNA-binding NtrC family response regulator
MAHVGLVEAASGGTLFLDEVGDIPLPMQVKLLRLLESGTYRRVGSTELRHADVRLVSATHRDLAAMVAQGRFREDLYYRLSTFPIALPPLRERLGDLPLLANALLERLAPGRPLSLDAGAVQQLARYPFPGNVRELRNVLERAVLLTDGDHITAETVDRALSVGLLRRPPGRWPHRPGPSRLPRHRRHRCARPRPRPCAPRCRPTRAAARPWPRPWASACAPSTASCARWTRTALPRAEGCGVSPPPCGGSGLLRSGQATGSQRGYPPGAGPMGVPASRWAFPGHRRRHTCHP